MLLAAVALFAGFEVGMIYAITVRGLVPVLPPVLLIG